MFRPKCRAIFRLVFEEVERTINNACTLHLFKDQLEDVPRNLAETST